MTAVKSTAMQPIAVKSLPVVAVVFAYAALAGMASAAERDVRAEAEANGLTAREQRMLSGASSAYAEYRTSYARTRDRLRRMDAVDAPQAPRPKRVYVERVSAPASVDQRPSDEAETFALPSDD